MAHTKTTACSKCGTSIRNNNLKKHEISCGLPKGYVLKPRSEWGKKGGWNKGLTKETSGAVLKGSITAKERYAAGILTPSGFCTKEFRDSEAWKAGCSRGGGYRENAGRSKKFRVTDSFGKETVLQSTYELRCAEILNELGIKWNRPRAMKYNGGTKNYFADFYLPDLNIYLDPKNSYKAKLDAEKIASVIEENNVKVLILLQEHLTKEYIGMLIQ